MNASVLLTELTERKSTPVIHRRDAVKPNTRSDLTCYRLATRTGLDNIERRLNKRASSYCYDVSKLYT